MTEIEHSFSEYDCLGRIRQQTTAPQVELGWKTGMSLFDDMVSNPFQICAHVKRHNTTQEEIK